MTAASKADTGATTKSAGTGEGLLPRRYQEEIFIRAQEGNVIAALETGSGKTFIRSELCHSR
jgi:endoribonuclease Dicer